MHIFKGSYPVTLLSPPRRLVPSLGLGTTCVRQLRSGSCHHPTAATKCNVQPSQATAKPVGGKACSSTKGGLLCYIPNTYSIHKVSSLKFAYFQGKLFRYNIALGKFSLIINVNVHVKVSKFRVTFYYINYHVKSREILSFHMQKIYAYESILVISYRHGKKNLNLSVAEHSASLGN